MNQKILMFVDICFRRIVILGLCLSVGFRITDIFLANQIAFHGVSILLPPLGKGLHLFISMYLVMYIDMIGMLYLTIRRRFRKKKPTIYEIRRDRYLLQSAKFTFVPLFFLSFAYILMLIEIFW